MNRLTLVARGLRFHRRTHLGVIAGCAVSAAVLVGALFVGDSVRGSLGHLARTRLGRIDSALDAGNRFFGDDLAARLGAGAAPVLRVPGMAISGPRQVNRVEVLGVDARFFALAESPVPAVPAGKVALNAKLAAALGAKVGDEISLRVSRPGVLSRDAPLASRRERDTRRGLFTVAASLTDRELGRFSLRSDQAGPVNAFVELGELQRLLEMEGRANIIVAGPGGAPARLREAWSWEDSGLEVRWAGPGLIQLQTRRIYLDPAVAAKALELRPEAKGALSYLVDSITSERGASTPYSFMTAVAPSANQALGPVPKDMKDDEILVNRWLADRLSLREGNRVRVAYSEFAAGNEFVPRERGFRVRAVLEMEALAFERDLVPEFPGLTDVDSCQDWDIGLPLDEQKLKDPENEAYWKKYRKTPKAFVTLAAGREMWANRYGDIMSVRYNAPSPNPVQHPLAERLSPEDVGLAFRPVREEALQAAGESMDLGQLFLGMSVFLIAASLVLTAMLFVFSVEQRAREMGVLLAVGYRPGQVRGLFLAEGAALALLGSLAGIPLGWGFARLLLAGLRSAWSGAVADAPVEFHAEAGSAIVGAAAAAAISLAAMAAALWRQAKRPVRELVAEDFTLALERRTPSRGRLRRAVGPAAMAGAVAIAAGALLSGADRPAGAFFAAGALMLVGGIALVREALARLESSARLSVAGLGMRNAARRPGRGMAAAGMLACGAFIVISVAAMKEDLSQQAGERRSGTGGFELYAESSLAVPHDLNGAKGRATYRLTDAAMEGVSFLPLRVREGDDASCLNLNRSLAPTLLGVDPGKLAALGAFAGPETWKLLEAEDPEGAVPALVGESATAVWKLKKKVGDLLDYRDERGKPFRIRLAGALPWRLTVLQGRLLISHRHFTRLFPSEGGHRAFLVDTPAGGEERVIGMLSERLEAAGLDAVRSVDRLREFYAVEAAYLAMFVALGGLGLLLGSAGMGVLVLRTVMERRGELALLRAVGWSEREAARVVMAEHRFLLAAGLAAGTAAAALAVAPAAAQPGVRLPVALLAAVLLGTAALSLAWIWIATRLALRAPLLPALRNE